MLGCVCLGRWNICTIYIRARNILYSVSLVVSIPRCSGIKKQQNSLQEVVISYLFTKDRSFLISRSTTREAEEKKRCWWPGFVAKLQMACRHLNIVVILRNSSLSHTQPLYDLNRTWNNGKKLYVFHAVVVSSRLFC